MKLAPSLPLRGAIMFFFAAAGLSALLAGAIHYLINTMELRLIEATLEQQITLDTHQLHTLLNNYLLAGSIAFSLLATALGYGISARLASPILKLANQMHVDPEYLTQPNKYYGSKEVGVLASKLEAHTKCLQAVAQREKEFASNVSHELRTLIAVMRNTIELLLADSNINQLSQNRLRRLEQAVGEMGDLISLFINLAKPHLSTNQDVKENCSVEPAIKELLKRRQNDIKSKGLTARLAVQQTVETNAPRTALDVVLNNVLNNAIKYTDHGHISITLKHQSIIFEDTGLGIEQEDSPHIFKRNYRGRQTNTEGAGLGLSIVKRLCERYGWEIEVKSAEGKGTQVRLLFTN